VLKFQEILIVIAEVKKMKGKNTFKYSARRCGKKQKFKLPNPAIPLA